MKIKCRCFAVKTRLSLYPETKPSDYRIQTGVLVPTPRPRAAYCRFNKVFVGVPASYQHQPSGGGEGLSADCQRTVPWQFKTEQVFGTQLRGRGPGATFWNVNGANRLATQGQAVLQLGKLTTMIKIGLVTIGTNKYRAIWRNGPGKMPTCNAREKHRC